MVIIKAEEFAKEEGLKIAEEIMSAEELLVSIFKPSAYHEIEEALYEMGKKEMDNLIAFKMLFEATHKRLIKENISYSKKRDLLLP